MFTISGGTLSFLHTNEVFVEEMIWTLEVTSPLTGEGGRGAGVRGVRYGGSYWDSLFYFF